MLVCTSGLVNVLLVLVRVAASHVLAVPPLLPATGLVRAALTTFGIVPGHPPVETCNRVLSNVIESSGLQSCLVSPNYHYVSVQDGDRIVRYEVCSISSSRA